MKQLPAMLSNTAAFIARTQRPSGAVPWFDDGITDPWDHVESLMGLSIGGYRDGVESGFAWLQATQRDDGAWFAAYNDLQVADDTRAESNFVAYAATGLWHAYRVFEDKSMLERYWPMVEHAMNWVLGLQSPHGEIYWAEDSRKGVSHDALVTGCSSIRGSLWCCVKIAQTLGLKTDRWTVARDRLSDALRHKPERFDRTWPSKKRYSMDWFYPVMTGVVSPVDGGRHLAAGWDTFVEEGLGCRCVADQPWVTVAETSELIIACINAGEHARAATLWQGLQRFQLEDGSWWTGWVFEDQVHWPDERPTWTAAAVLLAADALLKLTPASDFFLRLATEDIATGQGL